MDKQQGPLDPTRIISIPGKYSAVGLANYWIKNSGLPDLLYCGSENVGQVIQINGCRRSKLMFDLRTQCEGETTVVHIRDREYNVSKDLVKKLSAQ